MLFRTTVLTRLAIVATVAAAFVWAAPATAADDGEIHIKARAVSSMSILRAASDLVDIRISRWTGDGERESLIRVLQQRGNHALAEELAREDPTGWVSFDPRGGGGPGRDPRRVPFKYAREIVRDDGKEFILITDHYPGYGDSPRAADGSKLSNYPVSFVLIKFRRDDDGEWTGVGRMFVGAKLRFDASSGKFIIDELPMDPVYLKDVKIKVK